MKKIILFIALAFLFFCHPVDAQRASLTKTAEAVEELQAENQELKIQLLTVEERLAVISQNVDTLIQEGRAVLRPVKTQKDAEGLAEFLLGFILFILVGISSRSETAAAWIDKYMSKGVLSIIVSVIVSFVGIVTSNGEFTIVEAVKFVAAVFGTGSGIYIATKQTKK